MNGERASRPHSSSVSLDEHGKAEMIAELLRYPDEQFAARVSRSLEIEEVASFHAEIRHVDPAGLEELYTRTFDLNPVASLDLGWHLYGEQYERGRLLAMLRELEADAGIDSGSELPDHLTVVLRLMARMEVDPRLGQQLAIAIGKIKATLDEQGNPYRHLIRAAELLVAGREVEA